MNRRLDDVYAIEFVATPLMRCSLGLATANFDPATAVHATVTNQNLTVTGTSPGNGGAFVFASEAKTSGKYYFEIRWTITGGTLLGGAIGLASTSATIADLSTAINSTMLFQAGQNIFHGGAIWGNGVNSGWDLNTYIAVNDVIGIAADIDNRTAWFRNVTQGGAWNGPIAAGDPATNINGVALPAGPIIPAVAFGLDNDVYTANFGATPFLGGVPSGFALGWTV
ncbi:hypothetical protein [Bradyrhizobium sp. USDA 4529]